MRDDSLVVSTGQSLKRLSPEGQLDESFGEGGTLTPPALPDGIFKTAGLAVDSQDRLIVAGTALVSAEREARRSLGHDVVEDDDLAMLLFGHDF